MPKKLFIGFDSPVPPSIAAGETASAKLRLASFRLVEFARVPDQRVLAPGHEGGGAADFAERRHRLDGAAQIRQRPPAGMMARPTRRPRRGVGAAPHPDRARRSSIARRPAAQARRARSRPRCSATDGEQALIVQTCEPAIKPVNPCSSRTSSCARVEVRLRC